MKKILIAGLLFFSMGLISCANSTESKNENKNESTEQGTIEGKPVQLTYNSFIENVWDFNKNPNEFVFKGSKPAIIDFYADWCGPCKRIAPILEKIAADNKDDLIVYKVNVDEQKELSKVFNIRNIPVVVFIPLKGEPMQQIGALSEQEYNDLVKEKLLNTETK
ncbi:MAG: thioredoxin family protein [Bacteroidales bacterium]